MHRGSSRQLARRFASVGIAAVVGAMGIVTMAGPAAAAEAQYKEWFIQSIPNVKVDLCVQGQAVKTDLGFGQRVKVDLEGPSTVAIRKPAKNDCKGNLLLKQSYDLAAGVVQTSVLYKGGGQYRLSIFTNDTAAVSSDETRIQVLHFARNLQNANFFLAQILTPAATSLQPTISSLSFNHAGGPLLVAAGEYTYWLSKAGKAIPAFRARVMALPEGYSFVATAVGGGPSNWQWVIYKVPVTINP